jgi:hypothetical protein
VDREPPISHGDVQTIMETLFDIRVGVDYLVTVVRGEDDEDDEPEEEEKD